ncbi:unnamed protein product [Diplocarpon coronariae]
MKYGILPGGAHQRPRSSPARVVAAHVFAQMRRPGRLRSRLFLLILTIAGTLLMFYGRRHATEFKWTTSNLTGYIPTSIADAIAAYGENIEDTRWDDADSEDGSRIVIKKPKFHLLVPAHKATANLCRTLLSASVLGYPPPIMINYRGPIDYERPGVDVIRSTFSFLTGKEAHIDDLVLVVEEDAWFQLPPEVMINRFFQGNRDASAQLLDKYGRLKNSNGTRIPKYQRPQRYNQTVLFASMKQCSNEPGDPACHSVPHSPLPANVCGPETDINPDRKHNCARYMSSSMIMGRVADLRPIYKRASEMLEFEDVGKKGSQYVFSQIFGEQEYVRTLSRSTSGSLPAWWIWLSALFSKAADPPISALSIPLNAEQNYEFGIGLDYTSSIFQDMKDSTEDVQVVTFDHDARFNRPIRLPSDLLAAPLPYSLNQAVESPSNTNLPLTELDDVPPLNTTWSAVPLAANTIIASSSVPASLAFRGSDSNKLEDSWAKMWFHNSSRALLRQYIRTPNNPLKGGDDSWWDARRGKGGVWTDRGEWLGWKGVCSAFDEGVFGDGRGEFEKVSGESDTEEGEEEEVKTEMKGAEKVEETISDDRKFIQFDGAQQAESKKADNEKEGGGISEDSEKERWDDKPDGKQNSGKQYTPSDMKKSGHGSVEKEDRKE